MRLTKEAAEKLMDLLLDTKDPVAVKLAEVIDDVKGNTPEGEEIEIVVSNDEGYDAVA